MENKTSLYLFLPPLDHGVALNWTDMNSLFKILWYFLTCAMWLNDSDDFPKDSVIFFFLKGLQLYCLNEFFPLHSLFFTWMRYLNWSEFQSYLSLFPPYPPHHTYIWFKYKYSDQVTFKNRPGYSQTACRYILFK